MALIVAYSRTLTLTIVYVCAVADGRVPVCLNSDLILGRK